MDERSQKQFGPFLFDAGERVLQRDGEAVPLTPKAFDLLSAFVEQPGRLLSKDDLLKKVWPETFVEESNLAYHVFVLRKALDETNGSASYIETVPKRGYRFTAPVATVRVAAARGQTSPVSPAENQAPAPVVPPPAIGQRTSPSSYPFSMRLGIGGVVLLPVIALYLVGWTRETRSTDDQLRAVPLTSLKGAVRAPTLSPDGRFVVFSWSGERQDNPDLYIQQIGAGVPRRVTTDPGNDFSPGWSPDGQMIASLRQPQGTSHFEVWLIPPLGGAEKKLADLKPNLAAYLPPTIAWCPDSRCLVATDAQGSEGEDALFVVMLATGEKRQLTHPKGLAGDCDPAMSPDGRNLVFRRNTTPFSGAFYRLPLAAGMVPEGEPVRLTSTIGAGRPTWTLDGREILFAFRGGLSRLDAMKGGTPERLPYIGQDGHTPVVARTGDGRTRLVYGRSFGDTNVWRIDTTAPGTGGAPPVAAIATTRADNLASLSPDGRRLAFLSDRSGDIHIWLADPNGSNAMMLTSPGFSSLPGFPRWSADGGTVAFHGDPAGRPDVIVMPAHGGTPKNLTEHGENGAFPSFSRDGRWIYFRSVQNKQPRIWKMPSSGGAAVQVTSDAGAIGIESHDGRDLYYVSGTNRPSALWRLPLAGGPPEKIVDGVLLGAFDVIEKGIYFLDSAPGEFAGFFTDRPGETRLQ